MLPLWPSSLRQKGQPTSSSIAALFPGASTNYVLKSLILDIIKAQYRNIDVVKSQVESRLFPQFSGLIGDCPDFLQVIDVLKHMHCAPWKPCSSREEKYANDSGNGNFTSVYLVNSFSNPSLNNGMTLPAPKLANLGDKFLCMEIGGIKDMEETWEYLLRKLRLEYGVSYPREYMRR